VVEVLQLLQEDDDVSPLLMSLSACPSPRREGRGIIRIWERNRIISDLLEMFDDGSFKINDRPVTL
jgi:hypothetical protein